MRPGPPAEALRTPNRIVLRTLPRRNQRVQATPVARRALNTARQVAEPVNRQLAEQFHVEVNHAQSCWGLCARLSTKLTTRVVCVYLNRVLGNPDVLHIKALAFPHLN